jgi:hypothetical protein
MYIYTFLLRMTDTMTSQNIDLSSRDTLYTFNIFLQLYKLEILHFAATIGNFNYFDQKWIHFKLNIQQKRKIFVVLHVYT